MIMLTLLIITIRMACHGMFVTFKISFLIGEASTRTTIGRNLFANLHACDDDGTSFGRRSKCTNLHFVLSCYLL